MGAIRTVDEALKAMADDIKRLRDENERLNAAVSTAIGEKIEAVADAYARGRLDGLAGLRDRVARSFDCIEAGARPDEYDNGMCAAYEDVLGDIKALIDAESKLSEGDA